MIRSIEVKAAGDWNTLRKLLLTACAALALAGCATYDRTPRGAAPDDYNWEEGSAPSGNRLRQPEPAPRVPTEAAPPQAKSGGGSG